MAAFWIAHVTVSDETAYAKYAALATKAISEYGGEFLARGGRAVQMEGRAHPRNVVTKFPSVETAVACYHSPTYQDALSYAKGASERDLVIVEALPGFE